MHGVTIEIKKKTNFYLCPVHFKIYVVHSPTNALFINLVKSNKFTLKHNNIAPTYFGLY